MGKKKWIEDIDPVRKPSKYSILEGSDYFLITAADRCPTLVKLCGARFQIGQAQNSTVPEFQDGKFISQYGFYAFPQIMDAISAILLTNWTRPAKRRKKKDDLDWGVSSWAAKQTKLALLRKVNAQWKRLLGSADQTVVAVQRAVFSAAGRPTDSHMFDPLLYQDEILVKDVLASRGAAMLLHYAPMVITKMNAARLRDLPEFTEMQAAAGEFGFGIYLTEETPTTSEIITAMHNWAGMLTPSGKPYRSLSKTLINLPKNVPFEFVFYLAQHKLREPIISRSSVLVAGIYADLERYRSDTDEAKQILQNIFFRAKEQDVKKAMALFNEHTGYAFSVRRYHDVEQLVKYLIDAPVGNSKTLGGYLKTSIRYHQENVAAERDAYAARTDGRRIAALPPIPLPDDPNIRFLDTINVILSEGEMMGHCVGNALYCEGAVDGEHYLFHVRHKGFDATAQVLPSGKVNQIFGPGNKNNPACKWGTTKLTAWGRILRQHLRKTGAQPELDSSFAAEQEAPFVANVYEEAF